MRIIFNKRFKILKIIVLMGGNSFEKNVSINTGNAVLKSLKQLGVEAKSCIYEGDIKDYLHILKDSDLIFIALHGGDGENGKIQFILEKNNILYTGSNSKTSKVAINKHLTKMVMIKNKIPTAPWRYFPEATFFTDYKNYNFKFPIVIKPNEEGSTIGIIIVESKNEILDKIDYIKKYSNKSGVIIEKYIKGKELTVGILDNFSLPCIEIIANNNYYDYDSKYLDNKTKYICPALLSDKQSDQISKYSILLNNTLNCLDYSRVDFRMDENQNFYCLEINTLPGLTSKSLLPKAASQNNIVFNNLVLKICNLALKRNGSKTI